MYTSLYSVDLIPFPKFNMAYKLTPLEYYNSLKKLYMGSSPYQSLDFPTQEETVDRPRREPSFCLFNRRRNLTDENEGDYLFLIMSKSVGHSFSQPFLSTYYADTGIKMNEQGLPLTDCKVLRVRSEVSSCVQQSTPGSDTW